MLSDLVLRLLYIVWNDGLNLLDGLSEFLLIETRVCEIQVSKLESSLYILGCAASLDSVTETADIRAYGNILACEHLAHGRS